MAWAIKKSVLVPFDFSTHSHWPVEKALELADKPSLVHILHVLPRLYPSPPSGLI